MRPGQMGWSSQIYISYTELATGLNFLSNGQWTVSNEKIDILPNGLAAATNGQHQVYFPADISNGRIEMVTPDGRQVFSQPLELGYFDGSNAVVLAELTNSVGVLVGNNEVIYQNAFNGLKADLKYYLHSRAAWSKMLSSINNQ